MSNTALISIIIPVYNTREFVGECIESVQNQTYTDIEIIMVDDGSTDDSLDICRSYAEKDSRICLIHQENRGVSVARNVGIDAAKGEYIAFLDSDDTLTDKALEYLMEDTILHNADITSFVKCTIDDNGGVHNPYEDGTCQIIEGEESIRLSLIGDRQTNSVCAKLFKRKFIADIRFVEGKKVNEDGFFLFCCYEKKPKVVQHNICIYEYRVRNSSSTRGSFSEKYYDILYFCERKKEIIKSRFPHLMKEMLDQEIMSNIYFLEALCKSNNKKYKKDEKKAIKFIKDNFKVYVPINSHEKQMARIIKFGLFPLYKLYVRKRYYK